MRPTEGSRLVKSTESANGWVTDDFEWTKRPQSFNHRPNNLLVALPNFHSASPTEVYGEARTSKHLIAVGDARNTSPPPGQKKNTDRIRAGKPIRFRGSIDLPCNRAPLLVTCPTIHHSEGTARTDDGDGGEAMVPLGVGVQDDVRHRLHQDPRARLRPLRWTRDKYTQTRKEKTRKWKIKVESDFQG